MIASSIHPAEQAVPPQPGLPTIRFATPADDQFVEGLQALAFGPGRFPPTPVHQPDPFNK